MPSGKVIAKENKLKFEQWVSERHSSGGWSAYVRGNKLNRSKIAIECCFARSVFQQNPSIKKALKTLEDSLCEKGVLTSPSVVNNISPTNLIEETRLNRLKQRLSLLEQQNQSLQTENLFLKEKLKQFIFLEQYLFDTGRMPR